MFKMDKVTFRGKEISFGVFNEVAYVNTTPHDINFGVNDEVTILPTSGLLVNATPTEELVVTGSKINFVKTTFQQSKDMREFLQSLRLLILNQASVEEVVFVGSVIAAQAYPGVVVALTPCKGYERVAPQEKRMNIDKFTIF